MTTHLTDAELQTALTLAEKATAGPVKYGRNAAHGWRLYSEPGGDVIALGIGSFPAEGDAAFYAAARTGWPAAAQALLDARARERHLLQLLARAHHAVIARGEASLAEEINIVLKTCRH